LSASCRPTIKTPLAGLRAIAWSSTFGVTQMISFLMLTRAAIINWTTLAALPLAITFDAIEGELERQGVKLPED